MDTSLDFRCGVYKHYKGDKYLVLGIVKHSETLESLVVYITLYDNPQSKMWVRPLKMFVEEIEIDGVKQPRFRYEAPYLNTLI